MTPNTYTLVSGENADPNTGRQSPHCGHAHRSIAAAVRCELAIQRRCARDHGIGTRRPLTLVAFTADGLRPLTVDEWDEAECTRLDELYRP